MPGEHDLYVQARRTLLDALEALEPHLDGMVLVGAQAVYFHVGEADVAVAPYTKDADLTLDPANLRESPTIGNAMKAGGFEPTEQPGRWVKSGIPVDLMVPEALAGKGSRGADLGVHGRVVARRARGLEGTLVDKRVEEIRAFDDSDSRHFRVAVAGPGALLVAKLHKVSERTNQPGRLLDKDSLDILRLLRGVRSEVLVDRLLVLNHHPLSLDRTTEAIGFLRNLFGVKTGSGAVAAARALEGLEDPSTVAASCEALVEEVMTGLEISPPLLPEGSSLLRRKDEG